MDKEVDQRGEQLPAPWVTWASVAEVFSGQGDQASADERYRFDDSPRDPWTAG